jgi:hypothetical protein
MVQMTFGGISLFASTRILGCIGPFGYTGTGHIFHLAWAMCKPAVEILHRGEASGRKEN